MNINSKIWIPIRQCKKNCINLLEINLTWNILVMLESIQFYISTKGFRSKSKISRNFDYFASDEYRRKNVDGGKGGWDVRSTDTDMAKRTQAENLMQYIKNGNYLIMEDSGLVQHFKNKGYDAIRLSESSLDPEFGTIAVWDNKKVKSAIGNRVTFEPSNPDIRYMPKFEGASDNVPKIIEDINIATNIFGNQSNWWI